MTKSVLFDLIRAERAALEALLAGLSEAQLATPGACGEWRVLDVLAHIVAWEERMLRCLDQMRAGERPEFVAYAAPDAEVDALNHRIYLEHRGRPPAEVQAAFARSYEETLRALEAVPEEDLERLGEAGALAGKPLWHLVAANTCWHYAEHRETIEAWLRGGKA